jgi:photosystem II stability/assembly factor-like uncharacterized protein
MADTEVVLLIGTRKGLFIARSSGGRSQWQVDPPQLRMEETTAVGVDPRPTAGGAPPRLFAGSSSWVYGTRVLHSDDLGQSWAAVPDDAIRFPERTGAALAKVWQITPGIADGEVWAGTEPSAVFRSTDGGMTFEMNDGLWDHPHRPDWAPGGGGQAVHTILPHPSDAGDVLVAMSTGGVYRTTDGGSSWSPYSQGIRAEFMPEGQQYPEYGQCVHKVARHPEFPDELYAQNHGGVFRSRDGGRSWDSIEDGLPAVFGFPVLTDPRKPGRVFVFPLVADVDRFPPDGELAVWRSDDGGDHWERRSVGLPADAWTAVMRDAACVDAGDPTGVYLGTRSGSVFGSADSGDSFSLVAQNLPDVLSLRAATIG